MRTQIRWDLSDTVLLTVTLFILFMLLTIAVLCPWVVKDIFNAS